MKDVKVKPVKLTKAEKAKLLKAEGRSNEEIKELVYPDQTPAAQAVSLSRALKDNNVQTWVADAFEGSGIDIKDLIAQYKEELTATKAIYFKGEYVENVPDYATRQKARDALLKLMQAYTVAPGDPTPPPSPLTPDTPTVIDNTTKQAMLEAIKRGDVKAIERIVFKDGN